MALTKVIGSGIGTVTNQFANANMSAGSVVQIVQAITTSEVSTSSTNFSDTGLTASITPSSTGNDILILFNIQQFIEAANKASKLKLLRGSTEIEAYGYQGYAGSSSMNMGGYQHLDSPSTTSATTYKVQFNSAGGATVYSQYDDSDGDGISSMLLMEIAR